MNGDLGIDLAAWLQMAEPHLPDRVDELVARAEAMIAAGDAFFQSAGVSADVQQQLRKCLCELREGDYAFCGALSARLEAMVRFQVVDRKVWELIACARESLREFMTKQPQLNWDPELFQMPAEPEQRIAALEELYRFCKAHPKKASRERGLTPGRTRRLLADAKAAYTQVQEARTLLRHKAAERARSERALRRCMSLCVATLATRLRTGDARWLPHTGEASIGVEPPARAAAFTPASAGQVTISRTGGLTRVGSSTDDSKTSRPGRRSRRELLRPRPSLSAAQLKLPALLAWLFPPPASDG